MHRRSLGILATVVLLAAVALSGLVAGCGAATGSIGAHRTPGAGSRVSVAGARSRPYRLPSQWRSSVETVHTDGATRSYLLVAPRRLRGRHDLPVYVILHGHHMTPAAIERVSGFPRAAGAALLVFPAGEGRSWNAGGCCGYAHAHHVDDVGFLHAVVDQVLARFPEASRAHVYAAGFSNGGRMAYRLACALPGVFAGIGAVEAVPVTTCRRLRPLDVEIVARRHDPLLRFGLEARRRVDGYLEPTVTATVAAWTRLDGCRRSPTVRRVGTTVVTTWPGCRAGTQVQYALYAGRGHLWSTGGHGNPPATRLLLQALGRDLAPARAAA